MSTYCDLLSPSNRHNLQLYIKMSPIPTESIEPHKLTILREYPGVLEVQGSRIQLQKGKISLEFDGFILIEPGKLLKFVKFWVSKRHYLDLNLSFYDEKGEFVDMIQVCSNWSYIKELATQEYKKNINSQTSRGQHTFHLLTGDRDYEDKTLLSSQNLFSEKNRKPSSKMMTKIDDFQWDPLFSRILITQVKKLKTVGIFQNNQKVKKVRPYLEINRENFHSQNEVFQSTNIKYGSNTQAKKEAEIKVPRNRTLYKILKYSACLPHYHRHQHHQHLSDQKQNARQQQELRFNLVE